ncbi:MAG: FAD binding domain-containing protein [Actinomycetota bacterium]
MAHGPAVLIPTSPAEAVEMFGDGDGTLVVGGGTIVVPSIRLGYERPATALMLHRAGLGGVSRDGGRVTIGAGTTLAELAGLPDPIASCVAHLAVGDVRGQATVGGNLCAANFEAPRGDLQGVLIALGAHVRSAGKGGERTEPVEDLLASRAGRLVLDGAYDEAPGGYGHLDRQHTHEYTALAVTAVRGAASARWRGARSRAGCWGRRSCRPRRRACRRHRRTSPRPQPGTSGSVLLVREPFSLPMSGGARAPLLLTAQAAPADYGLD